MKLLKKVSAIVVVVILFIGCSYFWFRTDNGKPKITNETIGVQVKELKELATIQYKYKEIASREDWNTLFNIKLPFTIYKVKFYSKLYRNFKIRNRLIRNKS